MYFCYLFLISSASIRSLLFLSFIVPTFAWNIPLISPIFLKKSLVFPILLFSSISLHCSLQAFLSLHAILRYFAFSWVYLSLSHFLLFFFPQLFLKPSWTTTLFSCISFSLGWFLSVTPVQCYEPLSIILQAVCLLDLILWIYSSPPLYNHRGFDLGHTWLA